MGPCAPRPPLQRCGSYGPASRPSVYPCRRSSGLRAEPGLVFARYADHLLACVDPARQLWWLVLRGRDLRVRRVRWAHSSRLSFFRHFAGKGGGITRFSGLYVRGVLGPLQPRRATWTCPNIRIVAPWTQADRRTRIWSAWAPQAYFCGRSYPLRRGPSDPLLRSSSRWLRPAQNVGLRATSRALLRCPREQGPPFPNSVECFPAFSCALFTSSPVAMRAVSGRP